ncbi:hypothetical protein BD413DRAFT_471462 [Trametes elegans]|nr:hypothetical protein BD413DRAFT_471462 [Trametes elegans]
MFYSRPSLVPHTTKIVVGMPPKRTYLTYTPLYACLNPRSVDILNMFYPSWHRKRRVDGEMWVDPDPRQQMEYARHLAKYVFPRQYGLSSPFVALGSHSSSYVRQPDYLGREQEIKLKGPCKTPKRLKSVLDMLEKMTWRHHKCRYKSLLDLACPSKVPCS